MPPNFDDQLERLLHRYADPVQPTRDIYSQIQLRLHGQTGSRRVLPSGMRRPIAFLVATVSLVVVVALFGALFLALRGGGGGTGNSPQSCPPLAAPATSTAGSASKAGDTLEVTRAYIGDDFMAIDYRITGSATSPIASAEFVPIFYLRDGQGQYVTSNGGGGQLGPAHNGGGVVYTGNEIFPSFAQPEASGAQTLFFGWFPFLLADRANGGYEVAFKATVVGGSVSHPHVTPAKAGGLTLQLVDLTINRTPNPVLTPPVESVRLHLRFSGLPAAPACDTVLINSFHSELSSGSIYGELGGSINGDQSTLTFSDGAAVPPAFANFTGRPYFVAGYPLPAYPWIGGIEVRPEDQGQVDMVAVFYAPQVPQDGTLTFTLDELHFDYRQGGRADGQLPHIRDYSYAGPWTLTIPLSSA
jgi:hypothetical protein